MIHVLVNNIVLRNIVSENYAEKNKRKIIKNTKIILLFITLYDNIMDARVRTRNFCLKVRSIVEFSPRTRFRGVQTFTRPEYF